MLSGNRFVVYGTTGHHGFDEKVLELTNELTDLRLRFSHIMHDIFTDGEPGLELEEYETIAGRHAIIFTCPITDKLELQLHDIVTACKHQYGAKSVTVVMSFLRYRRQDRQDKHEEITRLRWFIRDLKHWGADRLLVCEPHSIAHTQKYAREWGLELFIVDPTRLFAVALKPLVQALPVDSVAVYSPDLGSVGRAMTLAEMLGVKLLATPKRRINDRIENVEQESFFELIKREYGDRVPISCDITSLDGMHLFMREDELDTGTTAVSRAQRLRDNSAKSVRLIATHPVCSRGWKKKFSAPRERKPFDGAWFGNTRPRGVNETAYEGSSGGRVTTVDIAPAMAETLASLIKAIAD